MKKSTKVFKVSDPSQNVYGMTVKTSGIQTTNFLANPTCLLNHNYDKIMGLWEDLSIMGSDMTAVPVMDDDDPEALKFYKKIENGLLKGASIGIIPLAVEGEEITKCELLEISLTPVPANRNALVIYSAERVALNPDQAKAYMLSVDKTPQKNSTNKNKFMNENLRAALVLLCVQSGLTIQLSADPKEEELLGALTEVGKKITSLNLSVQQYKTAEDNRVAKQKADAEAAVTKSVDDAIAAKQFTADERAGLIQLGAFNPELLKSTIEMRKPVTLNAEIPGAKDAGKTQEELKGREAWTFQDWQKNDSMGLSAMQSGDPAKFSTLYSAYCLQLKAQGAIA